MIVSKTFINKSFKKLHFFDWLLLAGVVAIIVFFFSLRLAKKTEFVKVRVLISSNEWWWQTNPPPYWLVDGLQSGDIARDSLGNEVARITDVDVVDVGGPYRNAQVVMDLIVSYDQKSQTYSYNYQPLQVGRSIDLSFEDGSVKGLVMAIGGEEMKYEYRKIKVQRLGVIPEVAEQYVQGTVAYDLSGEVLATIEGVSNTVHQYYEFSDSLNRNVLVSDPDYRDVELTLSIKSFENGQTAYYVNGAALKIGNEIWFEFPQISSGPTIITELY